MHGPSGSWSLARHGTTGLRPGCMVRPDMTWPSTPLLLVMLAFCLELHWLAFDLLNRSCLWVWVGFGQALKKPSRGCEAAKPCRASSFGSALPRLPLDVHWSARRHGKTLFVISFAPALHSPCTGGCSRRAAYDLAFPGSVLLCTGSAPDRQWTCAVVFASESPPSLGKGRGRSCISLTTPPRRRQLAGTMVAALAEVALTPDAGVMLLIARWRDREVRVGDVPGHDVEVLTGGRHGCNRFRHRHVTRTGCRVCLTYRLWQRIRPFDIEV